MSVRVSPLVLLSTLTYFGCNVSSWDPPLPTTPTADNPCGVMGVPCLDMAGNLSGTCCNAGETCGGGKYSVGCPADECCNIRPFDPSQSMVKSQSADGGEMLISTPAHAQTRR